MLPRLRERDQVLAHQVGKSREAAAEGIRSKRGYDVEMPQSLVVEPTMCIIAPSTSKGETKNRSHRWIREVKNPLPHP